MTKLATIICLFACLGGAATAQECPAAVPFSASDSLANLSSRCGVEPAAILRANNVSSEEELRAAGAVAVPRQTGTSEDGLFERAGSVLQDTAREAGAVATEAGDEVSDYVAGTDLGEGVLDSLADPFGAEARMEVLPSPQGQFQISATGLRAGQQVTLTVLRRGEVLVQEQATADEAGALTTNVSVARLERGSNALFVLEATDDDLRLTATSGNG